MIPRMNTFGLEWVSPACLNLPRWNGSRCLGGPISIALPYALMGPRPISRPYGYLSEKVTYWLFKIFEIQKGRRFTLCVTPNPYATGAASFSQFSKLAQ